MSIKVAKFIDLSNGLTANQFTVGERDAVNSLDNLDPIYKQLLDEPVTATIAVMGSNGRPNLTPVWFDYEGSNVLLNLATHRKKVAWLRANPQATFLLMNPANAYHWISIKATVTEEISEDDPERGSQVTSQLNRIFKKYIGGDEYGFRDPSFDERRVLMVMGVDSVATFGKP
jgi:PPOX class probable F420-dependent enzyme